MAKATRAQFAQAAATLLKRLPQQVAAELIGKPAVWLRDNAHLGGRNADGTYNGPQLVQSLQQQYRPAELADADLEPALQLVEDLADAIERPAVALKLLERIDGAYGAAGLAAIVIELIERLRGYAEIDRGLIAESPAPTPEEIRAEAEAKVAELKFHEARQRGHVVVACNCCCKYRWGRRWREHSYPEGYAVDRRNGQNCPTCERELERRFKKKGG